MHRIQEAAFLSPAPDPLPAPGFESLFREHYPRLVKTLLRLTGNPAQAEELAADAFYRLHQHLAEPRPADNLPAWLYRTAMNLGLDALRANSRRTRREQQAHLDSLTRATPASPLYQLLADEQRDRVRAVISRLKPIQGQVLLMSGSGFSAKEIASVLGLKPDSLYVLIARARAQFEKQYLSLYGRAE